MRYHICVCVLEVAKIYVEIAKPCFRDVLLPERKRTTSPESHAAIRLQRVLSAARQASQRLAQGARVNTPLHGRGSRLSPDPSSTERKGRRHLLADSASFCRGVPASPRKADSWSRNSRSFPRATLENVKEISTCLNAERSGLGASMRTRVLVCVYHLSEVRMSICDTLFRPFAETFE